MFTLFISFPIQFETQEKRNYGKAPSHLKTCSWRSDFFLLHCFFSLSKGCPGNNAYIWNCNMSDTSMLWILSTEADIFWTKEFRIMHFFPDTNTSSIQTIAKQRLFYTLNYSNVTSSKLKRQVSKFSCELDRKWLVVQAMLSSCACHANLLCRICYPIVQTILDCCAGYSTLLCRLCYK